MPPAGGLAGSGQSSSNDDEGSDDDVGGLGSDPYITTVAGNGNEGFAGDNGAASDAELSLSFQSCRGRRRGHLFCRYQ